MRDHNKKQADEATPAAVPAEKSQLVSVMAVTVPQVPQAEGFQVGKELMTPSQYLAWLGNQILDLKDLLEEEQ